MHSNEPNFKISCGHCGKTFQKFESYKSHIRRKHQELKSVEVREQDEPNEPSYVGIVDVNKESKTGLNYIENMTRFIALFILKTKEKNQLSQTVMASIMQNTQSLVEESLEVLKGEVRSCLIQNGIDVSSIEGLKEVLQEPGMFSKAIPH